VTLHTDRRTAVRTARTRIVGSRTGVAADLVVTGARVLSAVGAILRRAFRRALEVITPLGWTVLGVAIVSFALGYGLGWLELVAIAYAASVLLLAATLYLFTRAVGGVSLGMLQERVVVGDTAAGIVTLENTRAARSTGAIVEVPVGGHVTQVVFEHVPAGSAATREFAVPTSRRGAFPVGPARTVRADPIGLVRREVIWGEARSLVVHPRTVPVPSIGSGQLRDLEGATSRDLTSSDLAFHALREYVPGDHRHNIHWRSSARTGKLMVRQFEQTRRSQLVIALTLARPDYASDEEFELAVSVAGSLGARAIRDTRDVAVVASERTPEFASKTVFAIRRLATASRMRLLDDLAVVDQSDAALGIRDVARVVARSHPGVSFAFLITGSATSLRAQRAAAAMFPAGIQVVVVVCEPEAVPELRRTAELDIVRVGYLEDLRAALDRARTS
jgi:uncharacterized protein (DUF58 family)